jgi:hypothetical protein
MKIDPESSLVELCAAAWDQTWKLLCEDASQSPLPNVIMDEAIRHAVQASINSKTKTYRYVLPTQTIAKFVNPSLDARCIQIKRGGSGAFDARTIAHQVIVPFDRSTHNVLGGSSEPYVNNPLRVPEVSLEGTILGKQKDKEGWNNLFHVLTSLESVNNPAYTSDLLRQIQIEIYRRLTTVSIIYPTPRRISLLQTVNLLNEFLSTPSGGDRAQAVATALMLTIGKQFHIYERVVRSKTNTADQSAGQVADIECFDSSGGLILAVEVKDVRLTVNHITDKLNRIRASNVIELLFLVRSGSLPAQESEIGEIIERQFSSGQNIYVFDLVDFCKAILALVGEEGRRQFLLFVGKNMDE